MDTVTRYLSENLLDVGVIDGTYRLITSLRNAAGPHCHDFYEFFVVTKGRAIHNVHGIRELLTEGSLIFIRPDDIHFYEKYNDDDCQFININFTADTADTLFDFLGPGFNKERLLSCIKPPGVIISKYDMNYIIQRFNKLNTIPRSQSALIKTDLRLIIIHVLTRYFSSDFFSKNPDIPLWLQELCISIARKENFSDGVQSLKNLSGKTSEYLCRVFKQYFNMTPTDYINDIKMNYAANLLSNSDMDILSISMESGYNNLSHFYHLFKKKYGMTPMNYRKIYKLQQIF